MRQRRLTGTRSATDEDEPYGAAPETIQRDVDMPTGSVSRRGMALSHPNTVNLRPNHRAVGDVEIAQRRRRLVVSAPGIFVEEVVAEFFSPEELQIHGQE